VAGTHWQSPGGFEEMGEKPEQQGRPKFFKIFNKRMARKKTNPTTVEKTTKVIFG
jgi:hypothetical protein